MQKRVNLKLTGIIEKGHGHGKYFIELPWVKKQVIEKVGFDPYPGTLNMILDEAETQKYVEFIKKAKGIIIEPVDSSFFIGKCIKIFIEETTEGAVIIPLMPGYPENKVEIISPVYLRERFSLADGDNISISF